MVPLHPSIVHFPIVLLISAAGLYLAGLISRKPTLEVLGFVFHALGLVACIIAIFTGDFESDRIATDAVLKELIERHERMATIATYGFGLLGIWAFLRQKSQLKVEKIGFVTVFVALVVFLGLGARIGGEMVYLHGAGVAPMQGIILQNPESGSVASPPNSNDHTK